MPNVFGKWSRPNYNSVIATFCYNIARGLPIQVNDKKTEITIAYIDDVVDTLLNDSELVTYKITLGKLADKIKSFKEHIDIPVQDGLGRKLYATYLSYLPEDRLSYPLKMNLDGRGSFAEILHTPEYGQVSVNITKPDMVKGNHWHHTKNEKFLVVAGNGIVRLRKVDDKKIIEYKVSGNKMEVVDIPPGHVHNIENIGKTDLVALVWANENFDPKNPDTYFELV